MDAGSWRQRGCAVSVLPHVETGRQFNIAGGKGRILTAGTFFLVVAQRAAGVGRETRDGVEVRQAEQAHEEVGEVPDELQRCEGDSFLGLELA